MAARGTPCESARMRTNYFDEPIARRYDASGGPEFDPAVIEQTADFLADLAGDGPALEFAIGTGRIALPLSRRGVRVHGIDLSEAMVAQLRRKPGGDAIGVTIGDFATTKVDDNFQLAYLVFNTIGNLTTQDDQVACFENAAAHLEPAACFVIEVLVPRLQRLPPGERFQPFLVTPEHLGFDEFDVANQSVDLAPLLRRQGRRRGALDAVPLRVAGGTRPDGTHRGDEPARTLERLGPRPVHQREPQTHLRLAKAERLNAHASLSRNEYG